MKSYLHEDQPGVSPVINVFDPGLDIGLIEEPMGFSYGPGIFGPQVERRKLKDISKSLMNPDCSGPDIVYSIAMDVGKIKHK